MLIDTVNNPIMDKRDVGDSEKKSRAIFLT